MDPEINEEYLDLKNLELEIQELNLNVEQQKFYDEKNLFFKCHIIERVKSLDNYIHSSFTEIEEDL